MNSEDCFCNLKIVHLSSKELTEQQIKLLSKGLKFTPTPKKDMCEISAGIQNFCMRLGKKEFFEDKLNRTLQTPMKVWREIKVTFALLETVTLP